MSIGVEYLNHLYAVPKNEILNLLRQKFGDELVLNRASDFFGHPVVLDNVRRSSHKEIITLASLFGDFTEQDAQELFEEYRYRGTKSIYIYYYPIEKIANVNSKLNGFDQRELNNAIAESFRRLADKHVDRNYQKLSTRELDQFKIAEETFWEIVYSYIAPVQLNDPETEEPLIHPDLRLGFIWVNRSIPWIAISARDESIAVIFKDALEMFYGFQITRMLIYKEVEIAIEGYENIRRTNHIDKRGVRKRVTHSHLSRFQDEIQEIQQHDQSQERPSSGYNLQVADVPFVFSYSREKGSISFSKLIPTTRLRQFCAEKITEIYDRVLELQANSPDLAIPLSVEKTLKSYHPAIRAIINEILPKLIMARRDNLSMIPLEIDPPHMIRLEKYFNFNAETYCQECGDIEDIYCNVCGRNFFEIRENGFFCKNCDGLAAPGSVVCMAGHVIAVTAPEDIISLYPTQTLLDLVDRVMTQAGQQTFSRFEDGFYIHGKILHVFAPQFGKIFHKMNEIPEFQAPASIDLTEGQAIEAKAILSSYKEKCGMMSLANCHDCVVNRKAPYCFMRLFGLFDRSYTPRPHHNGEFGDVVLNISIDGRRDQTLVILLKSKSSNKKVIPITFRHVIGRDLYTQIDEFWTNPNVQMIGIAVPQILDDGFLARLRTHAQSSNKKLIYFGEKELSQLIQYVMQRDRITSSDL